MALAVLEVDPAAPPGQMTFEAWRLARTSRVFATSASRWTDPLIESGVPVESVDAADVDGAVGTLLHACRNATSVVWLCDSEDAAVVAGALAQAAAAIESLEVAEISAAVAPQGAAVAELVRIMDVLRSPGGCPWDAEQTHESLLKYLVEETYEVVDAVDTGDRDHLREELGDLLLQIVFHSRIAQEAADGFDIDEVAAGIAAKMVRRHPHVFADGTASTSDEVAATWDELKRAEKSRRSALDGIARAQPALNLAQAYVRRASSQGMSVSDVLGDSRETSPLGRELLRLIERAEAQAVDAEAALREAANAYASAIQRLEQDARD